MDIPNAAWTLRQTGWADRIRRKLRPRRWRLLLSGCCRGLFADPVPDQVREAFDACDRLADTSQTKAALQRARHFPLDNPNANPPESSLDNYFLERMGDACDLLRDLLRPQLKNELLPRLGIGAQWTLGNYSASRAFLRRVLAEFDPPAGAPTRLDPRWKSADVLALAHGIYRDRAFDRLPILADALMDAGCDDQAILAHCRSKDSHVRGCWALDLVLDGHWDMAWRGPAPAPRPKPPTGPAAPLGSPFQITPAVRRDLDAVMQAEGHWSVAEAIARAYAERQRYRRAAVGNTMRSLGYTAEQAAASVAFDCLPGTTGQARECGIARRVRLDDPRELAQYLCVEARAEWIHHGNDPEDPGSKLHAVILGSAVHDGVLLRRFLESSPYPLRAGHPDDVCCYNAVYALATKDLATFRRLFPYKPKRKADSYPVPYLQCLGAVAANDPDRFRTSLEAMLEACRRSYKGQLTALIDVFSHGIYELCRRAAPKAVAAFDVNHPPPWDAALARWVRDRRDPLADLDWEAIPEELRAGLRDLTRPVWWDAPMPGRDEDDEE